MYPWVSEGSIRKYNRAVEQLRKEGKTATEEAIKELYILHGGLIVEQNPEAVDEDVALEQPRRGRPRKAE